MLLKYCIILREQAGEAVHYDFDDRRKIEIAIIIIHNLKIVLRLINIKGEKCKFSKKNIYK